MSQTLVAPLPNVEAKKVEVPTTTHRDADQQNPNSFWGLAGSFVKGFTSSSSTAKSSEPTVELKKLMAQSEEDSKGQLLLMQIFGLLALSIVILIAFKFLK